ncbi:MAG: hypothetical protein RJA36_617 [Pseudomonadota bacterium]
MFKKLIAYFRNGGAAVMHLLPPQPVEGGGPVPSGARVGGAQHYSRPLAVWEIPAYQRRARSGDRVVRL